MAYLTFIFLLFSIGLNALESPIFVEVSTENQLLPLFLNKFDANQAALTPNYIAELEKILQFDLSNNGKTYLTKNLREASFEIAPSVHEKQLGALLKFIHNNTQKKVDGLTLTGNLNEDRKQIHHLADIIHKTLFNSDGIASTRILYTVKFKGKEVSEVFESDYDGANARQVTHQKSLCVTPCYIPPRPGYVSGSFAFVSYEIGQPKIYFASLEDGKMRRFSLLKGNQLMPAISLQRDKIAFISDVTGNPDLFVQAIDMEKGPLGKPRQIFSSRSATQGSPAFSPDGERIAFVSNKDGTPRIYLIELSGERKQNQARLLTKQNRENTAPAWSPDGKKLAYCALTKGIRQIWIYDFEKNMEWQLTSGGGHKENPAFAPNSLHLIYNGIENEKSDLYLINLNQKSAVKITSGPHEKRFPAWEPRP